MSDYTERTSTGIVGFDAHLQGGYPKGKIILEGPSSEERNTFALSFAAEGLREEDSVVVVTSSISPTKVRRELRKLGIDTKSFERKGHLVIIDWYSHSASEIFEIEEIGAVIKCPGDALHLNEAFSKAISRFPREGKTRAVIEGLSTLIGEYDMNSAQLLANSIVSVLGRDTSTALFVIDSEMHDSATIYQLQKSFDGHIKLNRIKGEGAVVGEISVRSFKNTETPSENLVLERSEDWALRIRSDAEPREEELDEEISDLMGSLKKDSENAVTWFELGTHYASEGEYRKAHECFDTAIKLQPNYLAAWTSKANMYIDEGENDEAVQCYRKALRLQTDSEETLEEPEEEVEPSVRACPECGTEVSSADPFCLGCGMDLPSEPLEPRSKPVDEVLAMCEEKLRKDPADVDAWFVKGLCLARLGRYQESVNALNETTRLDVEYPGLWLIKGKVYARLGDEKKADLSLRRGMDFARKDADKVGATFECSICGKNVELSADQCSNCGASFKTEVREASLPETEEDLFSFPEDVTLDDVLKRWESELTDLITPEEEPPEKPESVREIGRVKKRVVEGERDLTGRPVERLREAKLSRREGLTNGIGRTNGLTNGLVNGIRRKPKGRVNGLRGRTNGLTNGLRGRTNGLTNGLRGRTNGLTNGLKGRTNGLTNGLRGRTNGLTNGVRGRTNGLTNGVRGRTNGLTNGLTNGIRGRTNGLTNGLVNGLGRASGVTNGLVNGLSSLKFSLADGLTNGNGLTNGLGVRRFSREMKLARWKVFLIPLLAVVLLTVPLFVVTSPSSGDMVTIDGQFSDWNRQLATQMNPSGIDPNIDITEASVAMSPTRVFFYLEVLGYMLQGSTPMGIGDVVQIFIDSDREYQTGYQLRGLGADYMVEVFGISNGVRTSVLKEYSLTGSENDWNRWTSKGKVSAAVGSSEMEVSVGLRSLGDDVTSVLVLFHTLSWDGDQDFSDLVLSESGGVLSILQRSAIVSDTLTGLDQNLLNIELYAYNRDVTISSLQVDILGSVQSSEISSLKLISEQSQLLDQTIYSQNPATFSFDPIVIPKDSSISLDIRADIVGNTGSTVGAVIPSSSSIGLGEDAATVSYISSIRDLGYVGQIPSQTTIDGGFMDWVNCTNSDDTGEQSLNGDSNIDIACYDGATGGNSLFVYYDVLGHIMAGTNVPSRSPTLRQQVSSPVVDSDRDTVPDEHDSNVYDFNNDGISDGQTPFDLDYDSILDYPQGMDYWLNTTIPMSFPPPYAGRNVSIYIGPVEKPVVVGEDVARIFIDTDNSSLTGYSSHDIGSEYMVEIRGINGKATYYNLFEFDGGFPGEWKWNPLGSAVDVALDSRQLEMSVDTTSMSLQPDYAMAFETNDWWGGSDASILPATRAVPEPRTRHFADANGGYGLVAPDGGTIDITIDGIIDEATETDWTTTAKTDTYGSYIKIYVVYNATDLFVAIEVLAQTTGNGAVDDYAEIAFDTGHAGGPKPLTDDYKFKVEDTTGTPVLSDYQGDGTGWDGTFSSSSWTGSADDSDTYVTYEWRIPFEYVFGMSSPSDGDIGGMAVSVYNSGGNTYYDWPDDTGSGEGGRQNTPNEFGDLFYKRPRFVINEVSPLTSPEYVELFNDGDSIDINGIVLSDQDGFTWMRSSSLVIPNDVYLVLMGTTGTDDTDFSDGNGTLYIGTTEFTDAGDDVLLKYGGNDMGFDYMQYGSGGDVQSCPSDPASENSWTGTLSAPTGSDSAGRDKSSSDTNSASDWDNTGGPDVSQRTRGHVNYLASLTVSGTDKAPSSVEQGENPVVMLQLTMSADYGWIQVTGLDVNRTGTSTTESDISEATIWEDVDGNGEFDAGTDTFLASGTYDDTYYSFSGFNIYVQSGSSKNILVVYNISSTANTGVTVGARIDGESNVTIPVFDSVVSFSAIQSTNSTINGNELLVYGGDITPSVAFRSEDLVEMLNITLSTEYASLTVTQIDVTLTGTGSDSDIDEAVLYDDVNDDGDYDAGTDIPLRAGTYSGGVYTFSSLSITVNAGTDENLLVMYNISATATLENTVGAKINDENDFTVTSPDTVATLSSISSSNVPIRYSDIFVIEVTGEVYESTDGGKTFTNPGDAGTNFVAICANKTNSDIYALVDDGSVYLSTDKGQTWTFRGDAFGNPANGVDMTIDNNDDLYVLRLTGVVYSSTDGGATFNTLGDSGGGSVGIEANYSNNDLYVVETDGDIQYSSDGGNTWSSRGDASSGTDVEDIAIDTAGYIYVLEGSGEVYRSTDYGETFSQLSDIGDSTYVGMTIDYSYNYIYVVADDGNVYLSTNRGSNWLLRSDIGSETDYQDITCIIIPEFPHLLGALLLVFLILLPVSRNMSHRRKKRPNSPSADSNS